MWLYVPGITPPSPAGGSASILDSDSLYRMLAASCTWKTNSLRPESWRRVLRTAPWTTRLSGLTCEPSTVSRGVADWMESLADTPASRSASLENSSEPPTPATSGPRYVTSSGQLSLDGAFSRMSRPTLISDSAKSPSIYKAWATKLRQTSLQRRKLARPTDGSGSLSSLWQTASAQEFTKRRQVGQTTRDELLLAGQAQAWPTARGSDGAKGGPNQRGSSGDLMPPSAAAQWATPTRGDGDGGQTEPSEARRRGGGDRSLRVDAAQWPTPQAHDGRRPGSDATSTQGANLKRDVETWPIPQAADANKASSRYRPPGTGQLNLNNLVNWSGLPSSRPVQTIVSGDESSPSDPTSRRRLNPRFVEWLMGLPPHWVEPISYESSVTEWSRWWARMLSALSVLTSD